MDHERIIDSVDGLVVDRSRAVVVGFLLVTVVFAGGLSGVTVDSGTERFFESVEEYNTQQQVEREFGASFAAGEETTQVVLSDENVLSKQSTLRLLEFQQRIESDPALYVTDTNSVAPGIAREIDPFATTTGEQIRAVETATPAEVREASRALLDRQPGATQLLAEDRTLAEPRASATMLVVSHDLPQDEQVTLEGVQRQVEATAERTEGEFDVFGSAIHAAGFDQAIFESLALIVPMVGALILAFLTVAYRDPVDLAIALVSLVVALVWTFGFMTYAGIAFSLMMVAVPVLLLGVGIDFGIHAVNRYREERVTGAGLDQSMSAANGQLLVAFFIVSVANVIGFLANVTSTLEPVREFGLVVAVGMVFTLLVFGVFLPALKLAVDRRRDALGIPQFSITPLGDEDSAIGSALRASAIAARRCPLVVLAVVLVITGGAAVSATDVESEFETEDFLPYADHPTHIAALPDSVAPSEFEITETSNYITETFATTNREQVTVHFEGPLREGHALEAIHRLGDDPPPSFVRDDGRADSSGIVDVIDDRAQRDPEFAALVDRNDLSGNGVPDRNLETVYRELLASEHGAAAREYLSEDLRETRVVYQVEASASQQEITEDARAFASESRLDAVATGDIIVFRALTEALTTSALVSFGVAFASTAVFLSLVFWAFEDEPTLGVAVAVPVLLAVVWLVGVMPLLGITFNALTATILAITVGLGVAYSVHIGHRFIDEYDARDDVHESLLVTMGGTGGGVTASVLTTAGSVFCLLFAVNPGLGQFGLLTGLSTVFSYLAAVVVLPLVLHAWARVLG